MPKEFPPKLFVTSEKDRTDDSEFLTTSETIDDIDAKDGDQIAVYRLAYVRPIRIKRNLALSKG